MNRHRILHIIPSLDRAGAEKQMAILAAGLPRDEFDVHVAVLTRSGPLAADLRAAGVPTTLIGKRWKLDPGAYRRLKALIADWRPDLVHTWIFAANAYGRAAAFSCGVRRVVAGERCVDPWKGWLELSIDRRLARRTDRIVTNTTAVRDFYARHGIPAEKFAVIPNAVLPAPPSDLTRPQLLVDLGLPEHARLVGVVGRLWRQKGVKHAIWAADILKVIRDDVHLLIIGDGPLRDRLERYRDKIRIRDKVHFLGHRDDVPRIMPHLDVLWSPSHYEGQSNAIMEAMAAGVPVVASDIPGTRDLVVPGETGYLVPVGKNGRSAIASHTNKLLDDPDLARRLGRAAAERAQGEFSVPTMIARHAELYRGLLAQDSGQVG